MSILLRAKRILPLFNFTAHLLSRRCSSSSSFTVDYLISTFGFSPDEAAKVFKPIVHLKSPKKPDSVVCFLNQHGFAEADIKKLITWHPRILCSSPEKTLHPNLCALREIGLSTSVLIQIILANPQVLLIRTAAPRITFWRDFLGGSETSLLTAFKNNRGLASYDPAPKISLLQRYGLSTREIERIIVTVPQFVRSSECLVAALMVRAKEAGFHPGSAMFVTGLQAMAGNSKEELHKRWIFSRALVGPKMTSFRHCGNSPLMVKISKKNLKTKMDFLMGEVRSDLSYIVSNPWLLTCS